MMRHDTHASIKKRRRCCSRPRTGRFTAYERTDSQRIHREVYTARIAVVDGVIAAVGETVYEAIETVDLKGGLCVAGIERRTRPHRIGHGNTAEFARTILPARKRRALLLTLMK